MVIIVLVFVLYYSFLDWFLLFLVFLMDFDIRLVSIDGVEMFFVFCVVNGEVLFDVIIYGI